MPQTRTKVGRVFFIEDEDTPDFRARLRHSKNFILNMDKVERRHFLTVS